MKNLFMILCSFFLFVGVSGVAKGMNDGQIRGKIKDFTGGDVMVIYYGNESGHASSKRCGSICL